MTKVEWVNPHAWIHLDVTNEDGTTESWMVEGGTPNTLLRRGVTKDSLKPGTVIIVDGYQSKGCRSGIYNSINNLQVHYRWYVTHCL